MRDGNTTLEQVSAEEPKKTHARSQTKHIRLKWIYLLGLLPEELWPRWLFNGRQLLPKVVPNQTALQTFASQLLSLHQNPSLNVNKRQLRQTIRTYGQCIYNVFVTSTSHVRKILCFEALCFSEDETSSRILTTSTSRLCSLPEPRRSDIHQTLDC